MGFIMQSYIAYTDDIDDVEAAVAAIRAQLGDFSAVEGHTLGILTCHPEFVHSGVVAALVETMPFPVVGMTTSLVGVGPIPPEDQERAEGALRLTMMVLAGEDVRFALVTSDPLAADTDIPALVGKLLTGRDTPAMLLTFTPAHSTVPGDALCSAVSLAMPDVPLFGGVGVDDSAMYNEDCYAITPAGSVQDAFVMVLLYGAVSPAFFTASVPADRMLSGTWKITDSEGSLLRTVNDRPVLEYLEDLGLTRSLAEDGALTSLSLILEEPGKPPYSHTMLAMNPDGSLLCGGWMPCGSAVRLARFEKPAMLSAADGLLKTALSDTRRPVALLVWCCATRSAVLGDDMLAEIHLLRQAAGDIPFLVAYAGGEICPGVGESGQVYNQFHNQSFTLCALY
jgi:hypothetical protein